MKRTSIVGLLILSVVFLVSLRIVRATTPAPSHQVLLAETESDDQGEREGFPRQIVQPTTNTTTPSVTTPSVSPTTTVNTSNTSTVVNTTDASTTAATTTASLDATAAVPVLPAVSTNFPWAWILTRSAGIASFILLALLSVTGMLLTTGVLYRFVSPSTAWSLHRAIGSVLLFSVLAHMAGLYLDSFIKMRLVDILIPFVSPYRTTFVALGVTGMYLMFLILASSLYTMTSHAKFWRTVHFFGFPMFVLIFLHGLLIGTDAKQWWMHVIYIGSAVIVGLAVIYRMAWKYRARQKLPPG